MSEIKDDAQTEQESTRLSQQTISISGTEILSVLGSGGMSTVYKARQVAMDRAVAIKVLHKHLRGDPSHLLRFNREARLSTLLDHPNIASLFAFGTTADEQPYLVMEYCQGETLKERMERQKSFTWNEISAIFDQICLGLAHAHQHGVVHRDLKPANVFLRIDPQGAMQVKLIDFGIAKLLEEEDGGQKLTRTGLVLGTPYYMSPEQCMSGEVGTRSDIYALGCLLYHVIAGRPPFDGESTLEIAGKQVSEQARPVDEVSNVQTSTRLADVIARSMQKNPEDRFQSAEEMRAALSEVGADALSINSGPRKVRQPLKLWTLKKTISILTVILIPLVVLAGGTYWFLSNQHSKPVAEAEKLLDSGNYEDATPLFIKANSLPLNQEDATRLLNDLSDLVDILRLDRTPPAKVHLPPGTEMEKNESSVMVARIAVDSSVNTPSKAAMNRAHLAAANANGGDMRIHHLNSIDVNGLSPEDSEYFTGMVAKSQGEEAGFHGHTQDGILQYQLAIEHLQRSSHPGALIAAMLTYANANGDLGMSERCEQTRRQAMQYLPAAYLGKDRETARSLVMAASMLMNQQNFDEAQRALDHAASIYAQKSGGAADMMNLYRLQAMVLVHRGQYLQADKVLQKAFPEASRCYSQNEQICDLLNECADCQRQLKDEGKCRKYLQATLMRARDLRSKEDRLQREAAAYLALSESWRRGEDNATADRVLRLAITPLQDLFKLDVARQVKKPSDLQASALNTRGLTLANSLARLYRFDEARSVLKQELQTLQKTMGPCRPIVECYVTMSIYEPIKADQIHCAEQALSVQSKISKTPVELQGLNDLRGYVGMLYEQNGRPQDALPLLEQVERFCSTPNYVRVNSEVVAPLTLANTFYKLGRKDEALALYKEYMPKLRNPQYLHHPVVEEAWGYYNHLFTTGT